MSNTITANARQTSTVSAAVSDSGVLRGSIGLTIITLAGFGFFYSLAGVGLGQMLFPDTANGSIIERNGQIIGSALVAQPFISDAYFQSRPSAAGYNPMSMAGSNQARTNPDMRKRVEETRNAIAQREDADSASVPSDLITQSGSGIDPHISPQAAAIQVERVARARGIGREVVSGLVAKHTEGRQLGVLGAPRINALALNLALDALSATPVTGDNGQ